MDDTDHKMLDYLYHVARCGGVTPSFKQIGRKVGLGPDRTSRRLKILREQGLFEVEIGPGRIWKIVTFDIDGRVYQTAERVPKRGRKGHAAVFSYGGSEISVMPPGEQARAIDALYLPHGGEFAYRVNR